MASSKAQSYFETATGRPVNPLWLIRALPAVALICLALALVVWKAGNAHNFCIGLAAGFLLGLLAQTFSLKSVEVNQDTRRPDVEDLSVVR